MHLTYANLERLRCDPDRAERAHQIRWQIARYRGSPDPVFVPDVPIKSTEPVTREEMWFHGLGPVAYANMVRRFKNVLEPLTQHVAMTWVGGMHDVVAAMGDYWEKHRKEWDRWDQEDGVRSRHLRLSELFTAFYLPGDRAIDLLAGGPPGDEVYGEICNGVHRLFLAQVLAIETMPAWVSFYREGPFEVEDPDKVRSEQRDVEVITIPARLFDSSSVVRSRRPSR